MNAFVMMPYRPEHQQVMDLAIGPALQDVGVVATLVKDEQYVGPVFERIQSLIADARLCIADVTGGNPNVMWEAAYGEALGKPIVFIAQGTAEAIPFNIRQNRCILYAITPEGMSNLRRNITETVRSILAGETSDLHLLRQMLLPRASREPLRRSWWQPAHSATGRCTADLAGRSARRKHTQTTSVSEA